MLTIRQLFILISLLYSLVMVIALVAVHAGWIYPEKVEEARRSQQRELSSIDRQIGHFLDEMSIFAQDQATRKEVTNSLLSGAFQTAEDTFTPAYFDRLNIHGLVISDQKGKIVTAYTYENHQVNRLPANQDMTWFSCSAHDAFKGAAPGFGAIGTAPYMMSSASILNNNQQTMGYLTLLRQVNDTVIHSIHQSTGSTIALTETVSTGQLLSDKIQQPKSTLTVCQPCQSGTPAFCLSVHPKLTPPPFIHQEGVITVLLFSLLPMLVSILSLGLLIEPIRKAIAMFEAHGKNGAIEPIHLSSPIKIQEFEQLSNAYNAIAHQVSDQQNRLETLSNTDRLTGIPNRRAFDESVQEAWNRILRRNHSIALVMIDIDYFKIYNDHFGHQAGDDVLKQVAAALRSCSQRADEIVARYGGEEFALIIYINDAVELNNYRQRLKEVISDLNIDHPRSPAGGKLTISAGIAWIKDSGSWLSKMTSGQWVKYADIALYDAKFSGRNCAMIQLIDSKLLETVLNTFEEIQTIRPTEADGHSEQSQPDD